MTIINPRYINLSIVAAGKSRYKGRFSTRHEASPKKKIGFNLVELEIACKKKRLIIVLMFG